MEYKKTDKVSWFSIKDTTFLYILSFLVAMSMGKVLIYIFQDKQVLRNSSFMQLALLDQKLIFWADNHLSV